MLGLGSSDGPRRRLQAELQALAAAAAALFGVGLAKISPFGKALT